MKIWGRIPESDHKQAIHRWMITQDVIKEIRHAPCAEYSMMCTTQLYSIDAKTFLKIYRNDSLNITLLQPSRR